MSWTHSAFFWMPAPSALSLRAEFRLKFSQLAACGIDRFVEGAPCGVDDLGRAGKRLGAVLHKSINITARPLAATK